TGTCASRIEIACNDYDPYFCGDGEAVASFTATAGVTNRILAAGINGASGTLTIKVQRAPVTNDECTGAIMLTEGVSLTTNTTQATSLGDGTPSCRTDAGRGVWFTYTPTFSGVAVVSTC